MTRATGLVLLSSILVAPACSRAVPDCAKSVEQFRATLRTDPTLATAPDSAIDLARAHRTDTSAECIVANRDADDAEAARKNPPASPEPSAQAAVTPVRAVPGATPRVHFEIGATPFSAAPTPRGMQTAPPRAPTDIIGEPNGPASEGPSSLEATPAPTKGEAAVAETAPPAASPTATADARATCHKDCDNVANFQARVACNQRCDGATPLPGATASPTIIH